MYSKSWNWLISNEDNHFSQNKGNDYLFSSSLLSFPLYILLSISPNFQTHYKSSLILMLVLGTIWTFKRWNLFFVIITILRLKASLYDQGTQLAMWLRLLCCCWALFQQLYIGLKQVLAHLFVFISVWDFGPHYFTTRIESLSCILFIYYMSTWDELQGLHLQVDSPPCDRVRTLRSTQLIPTKLFYS